jgi:DNA-3-methyladenine glycosylase II
LTCAAASINPIVVKFDRLETETRRLPAAIMAFHIHTEADLDQGLAALAQAEPRFAELVAQAGRPPLRRRPGGFAGLATTVVSQQLSTASAGAIWGRLAAAFDPVTPEAIIGARTDKLKRVGLSGPKIRALKEIARAIVRGDLKPDTLGDIDADAAHAALTAVHGIGPWTADIYLLGCLGHADAWPAGDLALQEAARIAFGLKTRPTTKEMGPLAESWRPWRAVAARVLWTYYRAVKGREGAPVLPKKPDLPKKSRPPKKSAAPKRTKTKQAAAAPKRGKTKKHAR